MKTIIRLRTRQMIQIDILDWLDETAVIKAAPPASAIGQREWLKTQLETLMHELDYLQVSPLAISEALHFYANIYAEKAQDTLLNPKD